MTSLSDTLTMGIVLSLVFGSIVFYLYSRLLQVEKRMNLTENILLDLKMATENTLFSLGPTMGGRHSHDEDDQNERVEAISEPVPVPSQEVEELGEDDFYKSVLANTLDTQIPEMDAKPSTPPPTVVKEIQLTDVTSRPSASSSVQVTKMEPNYEAMSLKELKNLAKQRGLSYTSHAGKKEVIDILKKGVSVGPEAGSPSSSAFPIEGAELVE